MIKLVTNPPDFTVTRIFDSAGEPFVSAKRVAQILREVAKRTRDADVISGESVAEWFETFAGNLDAPRVRSGENGH